MGFDILRRARAILIGAFLLPAVAAAQEQWSFPAGSSPVIIDRMVKVAQLRDGDVVVDLGSFDGRIVLAAVRSNDSNQPE